MCCTAADTSRSTRLSALFTIVTLASVIIDKAVSRPSRAHVNDKSKVHAASMDVAVGKGNSGWDKSNVRGRVEDERFKGFTNERVRVNGKGERLDAQTGTTITQKERVLFNCKLMSEGADFCKRQAIFGACGLVRCRFKHNFESALTEAEATTLLRMWRQKPCYDGLGCRDEYCVFGHNCDCVGPGYFGCQFPKVMHGVDRKGERVMTRDVERIEGYSDDGEMQGG